MSKKPAECRLNGGHNLLPPSGWNRVNLFAKKNVETCLHRPSYVATALQLWP